jgi:pimeloyl-ACP methyl ester carboxylesterase
MPYFQPFPLPENFPPTDTLFFPATIDAAEAPLLFFLPGNPALIHYYTPFLSHLSALNPHITILGASHCGFSPTTLPVLHAGWAWKWGPQPWGLEKQVQMKKVLLEHAIEHLLTTMDKPRRVLLMAHSMGAFLTLELLSRILPSSSINILGGIMLFPTVLEIAQSPQGRLMAPFLASSVVRAAAKAMSYALSFLPEKTVESMIGIVTRQPAAAACVTRALVCTPHVLEQTLVLAAEEMEVITGDRWSEEVWNTGGTLRQQKEDEAEDKEGKLDEGIRSEGMMFVFGQNDRWVAEKTRDMIMAQRNGGARMFVEERGLPHGFCIHHGEEMAELCDGWIGGILGNK